MPCLAGAGAPDIACVRRTSWNFYRSICTGSLEMMADASDSVM